MTYSNRMTNMNNDRIADAEAAMDLAAAYADAASVEIRDAKDYDSFIRAQENAQKASEAYEDAARAYGEIAAACARSKCA